MLSRFNWQHRKISQLCRAITNQGVFLICRWWWLSLISYLEISLLEQLGLLCEWHWKEKAWQGHKESTSGPISQPIEHFTCIIWPIGHWGNWTWIPFPDNAISQCCLSSNIKDNIWSSEDPRFFLLTRTLDFSPQTWLPGSRWGRLVGTC